MKAITLTQPWATLVAVGAKHLETRSWSTRYRGPLAIHAAKSFPRDAQDFARSTAVSGVLAPLLGHEPSYLYLSEDFPTGVVLATCELRNVWHTEDCADLYIDSKPWWPYPEFQFGDYGEGRFAFELNDVKRLTFPVAARGSLGLWEWSYPVALRLLLEAE